MKKLILLAALFPLPIHAALVEMWQFNDVPLGVVSTGTTSLGVNGGIATIKGAGVNSVATGSQGIRGIDLPGGSSTTQGYIDLPNGLISTLTDATFEAWLTIDSIQNWQRVFDFGTNTNGEQTGVGGAGVGSDVTMLAANRATTANTQRMQALDGGVDMGANDSTVTLSLGVKHHFSLVWDNVGPSSSQQAWYLDGNLVASQTTGLNMGLNNITDVNNWLGRSNWAVDSNTDGTYDQFAIYNTAFTPAEVAASFAAGPVPEPTSFVMLGSGFFALIARRRRVEKAA